MKIYLNGKNTDVDCFTIQDLWNREQTERELDSSRGFAIARNGALVPKREWSTTSISTNDKIEIVRAMSGG
jgi:sulfur carrier protein